ncbi:MAG: hypothetical protein WCQ32_00405 [bacterium]
MNKKNIIQTVFGITLLTATLAFAGWNANTSTPTGGNMGIPINTSSNTQIKEGGLSVGKFVGMGNAQFNQQLFMNGSLLSSSTTLGIGDTTHAVNVNIPNGQTRVGYTSSTSGNITTKTLLASATNTPVCADTNGNLILCSTTTTTPGSTTPTTPATTPEVISVLSPIFVVTQNISPSGECGWATDGNYYDCLNSTTSSMIFSTSTPTTDPNISGNFHISFTRDLTVDTNSVGTMYTTTSNTTYGQVLDITDTTGNVISSGDTTSLKNIKLIDAFQESVDSITFDPETVTYVPTKVVYHIKVTDKNTGAIVVNQTYTKSKPF